VLLYASSALKFIAKQTTVGQHRVSRWMTIHYSQWESVMQLLGALGWNFLAGGSCANSYPWSTCGYRFCQLKTKKSQRYLKTMAG